jgi:hypothetical protein
VARGVIANRRPAYIGEYPRALANKKIEGTTVK